MNVNKIVLESAGLVNSEEARQVPLVEIMQEALEQIAEEIGGLEQVETIVTGFNSETTYALMDALDEEDHDIYVDMDRAEIQENKTDENEWSEAKELAITERNNRHMLEAKEDHHPTQADFVVRVGDENNQHGVELLTDAVRRGVRRTLNIQVGEEFVQELDQEADANEETEDEAENGNNTTSVA